MNPYGNTEIPLYKSPYTVASKIFTSVDLPKTDGALTYLDSEFSKYTIPTLDTVMIAPFKSTASYNGRTGVLKIDHFVFSDSYSDEVKRTGEEYYKRYKIYNTAIDVLIIEDNVPAVNAVIDHEMGHAVILEHNMKNIGWKSINKLYDEFKKAKESGATKDVLDKIRKRFARESEKINTTPEWNKLIKESIKGGWKLPSKYAKSSMSEAFAECYALWKNGNKQLLTDDISSYIEQIDKGVRK